VGSASHLGFFRFRGFVLVVVHGFADAHGFADVRVSIFVAVMHGVMRFVRVAVMAGYVMLAGFFVVVMDDMVRGTVLGDVIFDGVAARFRVLQAGGMMSVEVCAMHVVVLGFVSVLAVVANRSNMPSVVMMLDVMGGTVTRDYFVDAPASSFDPPSKVSLAGSWRCSGVMG
jgi:hypothetical protein